MTHNGGIEIANRLSWLRKNMEHIETYTMRKRIGYAVKVGRNIWFLVFQRYREKIIAFLRVDISHDIVLVFLEV